MNAETINTATRNLAVDLRPSTFDEFIGSPSIVNQIRTQLRSGRVPTAILLSGPTGCGKTTLARCINAELNGELVEKNAADDTGVDASRAAGEEAAHRPLMGDFKVIVYDEAHQLTKQAQNALLKHVEDAPPSTVWIFSTTEPAKIIPTLRGRCISFALAGLTLEGIRILVQRALKHLGKGRMDTGSDFYKAGAWDQKVEEFAQSLFRENVTAPRAILMATERFAGGMDPLGAIFGTQDAPQAFEVAKAVAKKDWDAVRTALSQATNEEATAIRLVVVNYLKSMLLRDSDVKKSIFVSEAIIELTEHIPAIEAFGISELSARLYNVCRRS